jgi:hypothetical protein
MFWSAILPAAAAYRCGKDIDEEHRGDLNDRGFLVG